MQNNLKLTITVALIFLFCSLVQSICLSVPAVKCDWVEYNVLTII